MRLMVESRAERTTLGHYPAVILPQELFLSFKDDNGPFTNSGGRIGKSGSGGDREE